MADVGRSGSAIIEFAIAAPVLVALLLGVCDLAPSMMAKFKLGAATQAVADLATQATTVQASDVANYFASGADVMAPFSSTTLLLRISNIASDGKGNAFVYWSCGQGALPPFAAGAAITTTPTGTTLTNLLTLTSAGTNTSFIQVEAQYTYTAPAGYIFKAVQTMTGVAYTLPRVSTYVGPSTGDPSYVPNPPTAAKIPLIFSSGNVICNYLF